MRRMDRSAADELIFVDPRAYADIARWHAAAERLRRANPLPLVRADGFVPFRAVTRHADVEEIERNHDRFHNTMDSVLASVAETERRRTMPVIKTLIHMDGHEHREHRKITNEWFKPAELRRPSHASCGRSRAATWITCSSSVVSATSPARSPCTTRCTSS